MNSTPRRRHHVCTQTRLGLTLSEVLISMLIMSIGVVSLATLFPISVLRSIQASQLTNATLLSKNAHARLEYDPSPLNNTVIPLANINTVEKRLIDPFGVLEPALAGNIGGVSRIGGTSGAMNRAIAENLAMLPDSWVLVREDNITASNATSVTAATAASNFSEITPRTLTGPATAPLYRLTIFDVFGRLAQRRTLRQVSGNTLSWQDPSGTAETALPPTFTPVKCRVEVRDDRYTWMMTVRKRALESSLTTWRADIDLTVFFNRSSDPADEVVIPLTFDTSKNGFDQKYGMAGVDDDRNLSVDDPIADTAEQFWPGSDDLRTLLLTTTPAAPVPSLLKKGGYVFEPNEARWYRVQNISTVKTGISPQTSTTRILVDRDLYSPSAITQVIVMKGIVQVYEMGSVTGSQ